MMEIDSVLQKYQGIGLNFRPVCARGDAVLFYRTGDPTTIVASHAARLYSVAGIRTFLDLRSYSEITRYGIPTGLIEAGVRWIRSPFSGYHNDAIKNISPDASAYAIYYMDMLEQSAERLRRIMSLIAVVSKDPFLFGCHFGKDRTGVVTALLLSLLGETREEIAREYALTAQALLPYADHFCDKWLKRNQSKEAYISRLDTKALTIYLLFEQIELRYGGTEAMFLRIGVTPFQLEMIKAHLSPHSIGPSVHSPESDK